MIEPASSPPTAGTIRAVIEAFGKNFRQARLRAASKDFMNNARCDTKCDRANASAEANDAGPNQRTLKIGWTDPLLKPDQDFSLRNIFRLEPDDLVPALLEVTLIKLVHGSMRQGRE